MDVHQLQSKYPLLLSFFKDNGYSKSYIRLFMTVIRLLLREANKNTLNSYEKLYESLVNRGYSPSVLKQRRSIMGIIKQFVQDDIFPSSQKRSSFFQTNSYELLSDDFKQVIDRYRMNEQRRGKLETTIYTESHNAACFFLQIQNSGITTIGEISEKNVIDFFYNGERITKSSSYKKNIAAVIKACIPDYPNGECNNLLAFLPCLKKRRKNYPFLTSDEVDKIKAVLEEENSHLSLRDKAIGTLAIYTGLRSCDISNLRMDDIDWVNDTIIVKQQKTLVSFTLPLRAIVGNALFDYITLERPNVTCRPVFLTKQRPYWKITSSNLYNVSVTILKQAGVRTGGGRKGLHLFRHRLASSLLENGIAHPVISATLGHTAPTSLNPYLDADLAHLKACALSIESFPIRKEVFA
jgi:integrase